MANIGISDIALYFPRSKIDLSTIVDVRVTDDPSMDRKLRRAVESTGQKAIRFPAPWEDVVCLAGNAARKLLKKRSPESQAKLRHLAVGSETSVDHSKPISAYVQGMLQQAGFAIKGTLSSFQVQHACAGGTIALISVASLLASGGRPNESGMVLCSDIARYAVPSTAEFTQGAGAAALLVEQNPALIEIDLATPGYSSSDVDDFFRPLGSEIAKVKGQYSMKCYNSAAEEAFADHCARVNKSPADVLRQSDYFVFHVPFAKMAYTAARHLISAHLGLIDGEVDDFLKPRGFFEALEATAQVGNIYTGAAFLNLAALLWDRWKVEGDAIVGKKILFSSYGSGNTMIVLSATIAAGAPAVIATWDLDAQLANHQVSSFANYMNWVQRNFDCYNDRVGSMEIEHDHFYLRGIREDGYREYAIKT